MRYMEEFDVRVDRKRNRFYCILKGFFLESEIDLSLDSIAGELLKLTDRYDVILDIQDLKTSPDYIKRKFYESLMRLIQTDCRYVFIVDPDKFFKPLKKFGKSAFHDHARVRLIANIQEAEDFLEQEYLLKNLFYN